MLDAKSDDDLFIYYEHISVPRIIPVSNQIITHI